MTNVEIVPQEGTTESVSTTGQKLERRGTNGSGGSTAELGTTGLFGVEADEHPLRGQHPADHNSSRFEDPMFLRQVTNGNGGVKAPKKRTAHSSVVHRCGKCGQRIPRERIAALKPNIPDRCVACQKELEVDVHRRF